MNVVKKLKKVVWEWSTPRTSLEISNNHDRPFEEWLAELYIQYTIVENQGGTREEFLEKVSNELTEISRQCMRLAEEAKREVTPSDGTNPQ